MCAGGKSDLASKAIATIICQFGKKKSRRPVQWIAYNWQASKEYLHTIFTWLNATAFITLAQKQLFKLNHYLMLNSLIFKINCGITQVWLLLKVQGLNKENRVRTVEG